MISVIIPVYNTEKYLGRCIDSILNCTVNDFEVILINDGSTDRSGEICRRYCGKDSRVKLYDQENAGVSAARNKGIEVSRGEWIIFVDSDDTISHDFLEIVTRREYQKQDMLIFDHTERKKRLKSGRRSKITGNARIIKIGKRANSVRMIKKILYAKPLTKNGNTNLRSPCAKAYKKAVLDRYAIRFSQDVFIGEDKLFNMEYQLRAKSCIYIPRTVYFVEWRGDSLTHRFQPQYVKNYYMFQKRLKMLLQENKIWGDLERAYYENILTAVTEVLVYGIFNPRSTRTYEEDRKLCHEIHNNEIYRSAYRYSEKSGIIPRRILLHFFNRKNYMAVNLICRLSYVVLHKVR